MESSQNVAPSMMAIGMTEDMCKKMLDPKNEMTLAVSENSDGSFTSDSKHSLAPEFNSVVSFKIGETTTIEQPWPMTLTVTKKNENTWITRTEMADKVMITESVFHNYGMSLRGTVEGTALSFTEEFKKVSPQVTGFYVFESEKGLGELVKIWAPQVELSDFEKMKPDMALRIVEKADGVCVDERSALGSKKYSVKFDEEYEYCQPDFNVDDKRVTTKTAPGCFTTVCKSKKDGKVTEWSMKFTETGMSVHIKMEGIEATECYKRVPDIEGTWRMVAQSGMENYLASLGVTGTQAVEMISMSSTEYFTLEKLAGGKIRSLTNSKWFPSEMVIKMGETYTLDMPGFGSSEGLMTEAKDTILNVWKFQGKKITITEKISGDFMVAEYVVNGNKASTMKTIMTRD